MTNVIEYRGYQGTARIERDRIIVTVLHIDDALFGECENVNDIESTFHELVDDYVTTCSDLGREPSKPFKGSFNVRIEPTLHRKAAMAATAAGSSLNSWVEAAMRSKMEIADAERTLEDKIIRLYAERRQIAVEERIGSVRISHRGVNFHRSIGDQMAGLEYYDRARSAAKH